MNERIRELEKQCWSHRVDGTLVDGQLHFDTQKFAKLIVRECMACSTWVGKMNTNSVEPVHTAHAVNQRIKQQFGVEE
jgi:hypothetical protein